MMAAFDALIHAAVVLLGGLLVAVALAWMATVLASHRHPRRWPWQRWGRV